MRRIAWTVGTVAVITLGAAATYVTLVLRWVAHVDRGMFHE